MFSHAVSMHTNRGDCIFSRGDEAGGEFVDFAFQMFRQLDVMIFKLGCELMA